MRIRVATIVALVALACAAPRAAVAQAFPRQPIRLVVPFPPGGAADILARSVANAMGETLGQSVIVDNKGGAAGSLGAAVVAHAPGDGYTLGVGTLSTLVLNPAMSRSPLYDPRKDFTPIAPLTQLPLLIATSTKLPPDFAGVIDYARKHPEGMNYSSNGVGSVGHLLGEIMKRKFGFNASHVPYAGDIPIINALIGQQIQMGLTAIPAAAEFIKDGKINAAATTGPRRSPIVPNAPTMAELGYPDLTSSTWFGIVGPAGVPKDVVETLNRAVVKALADPRTLQVFKGAGLEPTPMDAAAFQSFVAAEQEKWGVLIKALDLHID